VKLFLLTVALLLATILGLPGDAWAQVEGQYAIYGREMSGEVGYTGKVAVSKQGATYTVIWLIGNEVHTGTGILNENILSVTFIARGSPLPGLAVYTMQPDGILTGQFTVLGGRKVGAEVWRPVPKDQEKEKEKEKEK
jgi:hypothetical protein